MHDACGIKANIYPPPFYSVSETERDSVLVVHAGGRRERYGGGGRRSAEDCGFASIKSALTKCMRALALYWHCARAPRKAGPATRAPTPTGPMSHVDVHVARGVQCIRPTLAKGHPSAASTATGGGGYGRTPPTLSATVAWLVRPHFSFAHPSAAIARRHRAASGDSTP